MLRLSLNIATTRLILSEGNQGYAAAGHVIAGFANFVMSGDFVIGTIVFVILITINFLVITKGATRIAEVGARFTLDAIPGKQMAIDADLSAGLIDEKEAMRRRRELEEESAFFGSMDGASKFVRGDAIAGIIITAVNVFGGIVIGVTRHDMSLSAAADVFTKLSVGDGLVTQIPALIISLAAGLLVSKGGTRGSTEKAIFDQLGNYPRALSVAAVVMFVLALAPGLPALPFAVLGATMVFVAYAIPKRRAEVRAAEESKVREAQQYRGGGGEAFRQGAVCVPSRSNFASASSFPAPFCRRMASWRARWRKMRRAFARQYGFVVPEIKLSDDLSVRRRATRSRCTGLSLPARSCALGDVLVITGDGPLPGLFRPTSARTGLRHEGRVGIRSVRQQREARGFTPIDNMSVMLTHLREVIRNNLSQLLSYKDMRVLLDRLEPEYRRSLDEIIPSQLPYSGLQAVLKLLLAERISIRNLHLILEAIAEVAPHVRRAEQLAEHVRMRMAQQICGDLSEGGVLKVLRLGNRWDLAFHQALKRDAKGEVAEFDIDPRLIEQFGAEATKVIRSQMDQGHQFVTGRGA